MKIYDKNGDILAFIVNANKNEQAKNFYTENNLDMQVASFNLKEGENIDRHWKRTFSVVSLSFLATTEPNSTMTHSHRNTWEMLNIYFNMRER